MVLTVANVLANNWDASLLTQLHCNKLLLSMLASCLLLYFCKLSWLAKHGAQEQRLVQ